MADVICDHCKLPVPSGLIDPAAERQFCCGGCRMVWEAIHGCGLGRFYELKDEFDATEPARTTGEGYESFDHDSFYRAHVFTDGDGLKGIDLYLEGVHCAACVWLVEKLPHVLEGVVESRLDIRRQVARIIWDPDRIALSHIARTLDSFGYPCHPYRGAKTHDLWRIEQRKHLIRIGVAGACAGNVMLMAFALYGGMAGGMEQQYRTLFHWTSLAITLIALIFPGRVFLVGALSSLRTRSMHMDIPVALALTIGTIWGAVVTVRDGGGDVYFESLTAVIFLLLVGRWIQHRQQRAAHDAVELLYSLTPSTARLIESDGTVREVPVEALEIGSAVEVRAGDSIPADGVIAEGSSQFDLSLLTGESRPANIGPGEHVHAGTTNLGSRVVIEVQSTGADTRIGRLMALVEQFARSRPRLVRLADRVAHYFVMVVLLLATITAAAWLWLEPADAVDNAIALLIVTCPCALGLATPLAVVAAIGRAAREGILIKGGEALEQLAAPGLILLDKTGTLTQGAMRLVEYVGDEEIRPLIAAVEAQVSHPIARALVAALAGEGADLPPAAARQVTGSGVIGEAEGRKLIVGSPAFVREKVGPPPDWAKQAERELLDQALTVILIAVDGEYTGVAGLGDPVLQDAAASIGRLRRSGWTVGILSGDHPVVVDAVARQIGIDVERCEGGASPERKAEVVTEALSGNRRVVMVGDGVNDAAALSAASVGIAVHGGAEASLAAADVFLGRPGLAPVVELLRGARRTVGVITRNLGISLLYNVLTASLAMAGLINPLIAAILMPISSLTVVVLSYRSRTFGP
ncbi:MAG: heavy metal translocating P-type ATPase [Phycisphaerales bacterium]|nr:MAG: heavy metal translocating P-type ATPase [Phycisphaerales bacterium]